MIKALIFDCFGVFYPDPVFAYMHDYKTPKSDGEALHELDKQAAVGELSKQGFVKQAAKITGQSPLDTEQRFFKGVDYDKKLAEFIPTIRDQYKTALLSNIGADMMEGFFSHSDYTKLFDEVVLSGAVGIAKPDPAIFELTCKRLGVELNEAVMIDDMQSTVDFVRTLGMKGICYKDFEQFRSELESLLRSQ